ncbi:MAG: hypothetical protein KatS3mg103_1153 [Phycisphaerales bacterium]|nr:MAG: hypothetical protein KatS3mg103_1153 [Phycisphaerales bacterium]
MNEPYRTVLLHHRLPDGSAHYDWLLDRDGRGPLLTFRLDRDISQDAEPFQAQPIADHRRLYLDYQGPIAGDRGHVERVACGRCLVALERADRLRIWVRLGRRVGWLGGFRQGPVFLLTLEEKGGREPAGFG